MKRFCLLLFILIASSQAESFAQFANEPIGLTTRGFLITKEYYVKCGIEMTPEQLVKLFGSDPNMLKYAKPMAVSYSFGRLFSAAASILITYPIIDSLRDNTDPNWNLAYIGGGCLIASIPFKIAFRKKAHKALAYYNSGYREANGLSIKLGSTSNGLGLAMKF
ncbi:hypothetical protein [Mangrovibacterium sp.]|uniref:hypothetical protein n=1 Tax=Mangrovibacterium sp. TaxID=1961364 RepID=UPI003565D03E